MDNSGNWEPPRAGSPPPPPSGPAQPGGFGPPADPTAQYPTTDPTAPHATTTATLSSSADQPRRRSGGTIAAAIIGVVALVGAGVFAVTRIAGGDDGGGADSPQAAGEALLSAVEAEDALGVIDVLLPGERETLRGPLTDLVSELRRIEVLSDSADLAAVGGIDIELDGRAGGGRRDQRRRHRQPGDLGPGVGVGRRRGAADRRPAAGQRRQPVRTDDRRRASRSRSNCRSRPSARTAAGTSAPSTPSPSRSAKTWRTRPRSRPRGSRPSAATRPRTPWTTCSTASRRSTSQGVIGSLDPQEFEALQRYAPLFIDDAQAELDAGRRGDHDRRPRVLGVGQRLHPLGGDRLPQGDDRRRGRPGHDHARRWLLDGRGP